MSTSTTTDDRIAPPELHHLIGVCRTTWPARWSAGDGCRLAHAVEAYRSSEELAGEPELAVCGAVVAVTASPWVPAGLQAGLPAGAEEPCPVCRAALGSC